LSLAAAVAPCKGKILKNGFQVFERGENLLQNGIPHFVFKLRFQGKNMEKELFLF